MPQSFLRFATHSTRWLRHTPPIRRITWEVLATVVGAAPLGDPGSAIVRTRTQLQPFMTDTVAYSGSIGTVTRAQGCIRDVAG